MTWHYNTGTAWVNLATGQSVPNGGGSTALVPSTTLVPSLTLTPGD